jgi:penicillin-binding protein 2
MILAACSEESPNIGANGPTALPSLNEACTTADTFLKAWTTNDFGTMYGLISPKSQLIRQDDFAKTYSDAEKAMNLKPNGLTYTLKCDQSSEQGTTAVLDYDMTFQTITMGDFDDKDRVMRLITTPRGWRLAWSTMDIFDQLAGGATLQIQYSSPARGTIYDRNGKPLAEDGQRQYAVTLIPGQYPNNGKADDCFAEIAHLFRLQFNDVKTNNGWVTAAQYPQYGTMVGHMDETTYNTYHGELEKVCHVNYQPRVTRGYASMGLASQFVGYVGAIPKDQLDRYAGYAQDALVGLSGIEQKYEQDLAGKPGASLMIVAPDGMPLRTLASKNSKPSSDVKLTIDLALQLNVENAINDAYNASNWSQFSTGAGVVVMNVNTGEILAIASYPSFDPDIFNPSTEYSQPGQIFAKWNDPSDQRSPLRNRVSMETSPLGSVMKIPSMVAAADSGVFKLSDIYTCTGVWDGSKIGDQVRYDWIHDDPWYVQQQKNFHGPITLVQALTASCDAYFWQVASKMNSTDANQLPTYAMRLGLGSKTGAPDISEVNGQIPSPNTAGQILGRPWGLGDALNIVIGQGDVQVTPLQVTRMMSGVANGGTLYVPQLVMPNGKAPTPKVSSTFNIDTKVLKGVQQGLCNAITDKTLGTANWVYWDWDSAKITVCGKTGTAQTGGAQTAPNGWFAAYAGPTGKPPEIAIAMLVQHGREGSETAAPIVRRIIEAYYGIKYETWPEEWNGAYVPMTNPGASDGGGNHKH